MPAGVIRTAGSDHVGIGADWDGVPSMPDGLDEISLLPALTRGLAERGHGPDTLRKVLGENILRVMEEVERYAAEQEMTTLRAPDPSDADRPPHPR